MKTPRILPSLFATALILGLSLSFTPQVEARRAVGLGVGAGIAYPTSETAFKLVPAWGFYTDIPLLSTFHITPSALVYSLNPESGETQSATDISINFKFVVPMGRLDLFSGVTVGVTSTKELKPHMGFLAGASMNVVSNIDAFINVNYKYLAQETVVHDIQIFAGPLFRFTH